MEADANNTISYILLIIGAIGTLATTLNTIYRSNKEQSAKESLEKKKQAAEEESQKVDIANKLTDLYNKIIDEMNEKTDKLQKEVDSLKQKLEEAIKLNYAYEKKIHTLQRAGMTLINAFEQAFKTREKRLKENPELCASCNSDDEAVLKILNEYRVLFQNGVDK